MDNDEAAKDQHGRECSSVGYSQNDIEEIQRQAAGRKDIACNQQPKAECLPERDCRCVRD